MRLGMHGSVHRVLEYTSLHVKGGLIALKRGAVMRLVGKPQTREPTRVGGKRDVA